MSTAATPLPDWLDTSHDVRDAAGLRARYDRVPTPASLFKECREIHPLYRRYIEASPFAVLATRGPNGLDTSPRGDAPGFVQVADAKTLLMPDRRGNDRIDSLRNVLHDPQVALQFLIPGVPEVLRVNGTARISASPALCERFAVDGKLPATVLVIAVNLVFFQCARAIKRSRLWDPAVQRDRAELPSPGEILQALEASFDGEAYDAALQARQNATLY
ncbi:pyridoxamine 5'-phosphate oxidase family protein [Pelomonas sp. APW6]|uniref:Pyridoxamine 5'-phosphate oxidase family protein n=1 Tax=Roseateles subflavus TaxID=3053353 RepID=A0ABT7LC38_9BURK|nr:pyridoxamine 5'-phosphate oxidase family protein [Pelomonas sp. APW6]MDL5030419.1 pyridoxamine 5'-phosphate oxidase family protein [Pelomonas sp. APW6]